MKTPTPIQAKYIYVNALLLVVELYTDEAKNGVIEAEKTFTRDMFMYAVKELKEFFPQDQTCKILMDI